MTEANFRCSVNRRLIDKNKNKNTKAFSEGFENVQLSAQEIANSVSQGYALSYQFHDGIRKSSNFTGSDIVAVDVDGGRSLNDLEQDPLIFEWALLIYTTPSHTPDEHHYRIVFGLERTISLPEQITFLSVALAARFNGDFRATDAARIFFGSKDCAYEIIGKTLGNQTIDSLLDQGRDLLQKQSETQGNNGALTTTRSSRIITNETVVRKVNKESVRIESVESGTSIYCPFHFDQRPSAFIGQSYSGRSKFIHCHVCQKTWWANQSPELYNFDSFTQLAKKIHALGDVRVLKKRGPLGDYNEHLLAGGSIYITNKPKLQLEKLRQGLTFVKSPKGSGKTTALPILMEPMTRLFSGNSGSLLEWIEENEDPDTKPISRNLETDYSVLLIGHRQALIREMCQRLQFNCYLDDPDEASRADRFNRQKRYGICLDSLPKLARREYDLIIIDESEQVLAHFFSETMRERRDFHFQFFRSLLQACKSAVCLDADLGWVTFNTITNLTLTFDKNKSAQPRQSKQTSQRGRSRESAQRPVWVYINEYQSKTAKLDLFQSEAQIIADLHHSVEEGKRIFLTSNSKQKIEQLAEKLKNDFPNRRILAITSKNSRTHEIQHFILNIKVEILNYDLVLVSPSLGTGVDITFEYDAREIDTVYGLFESRINNHFEIDQQLSRVRHPKSIKVWISPQTFNFETELGVVTEDLLQRNLVANTYLGFNTETLEDQYDHDNDLLNLAALVFAKNRASINNLRANFINYKEQQAFEIRILDPDRSEIKMGNTLKKSAIQLHEQTHTQELLSVKPLDHTSFLTISEQWGNNSEQSKVITTNEYLAFQRHTLELFYRAPLTSTLIEQDKFGEFRPKVRLFERLLSVCGELGSNPQDELKRMRYERLIDGFERNHKQTELIDAEDSKEVLLYLLLDQAGLIEADRISYDYELSAHDLKVFVKRLKKYRLAYETHYGPIRGDIETKPTRSLGDLLRQVGLSLIQTGIIQQGGGKTYFYKVIDPNQISLREIVSRRRSQSYDDYSIAYWGEIHEQNGFQTPVFKRQSDYIKEGLRRIHYYVDCTTSTLAPLPSSTKARNLLNF